MEMVAGCLLPNRDWRTEREGGRRRGERGGLCEKELKNIQRRGSDMEGGCNLHVGPFSLRIFLLSFYFVYPLLSSSFLMLALNNAAVYTPV